MQLCKKQAGYKDSWGIENEVLVKSNTRTHLIQTEVLWPCSNPAGDDQTRPNTRIILIPVQNGNKPKERINPLVNENDDDFQYTLPSSPILDPVKLVYWWNGVKTIAILHVVIISNQISRQAWNGQLWLNRRYNCSVNNASTPQKIPFVCILTIHC